MVDPRAWSEAFRNPHVTTNGASRADNRSSTEDSRVGVDNDIALNGRVSLRVSHRFINTERAKGDSLIDLHVVVNDGCLADDDTGAVVDNERPSDRGAWMDIHTR